MMRYCHPLHLVLGLIIWSVWFVVLTEAFPSPARLRHRRRTKARSPGSTGWFWWLRCWFARGFCGRPGVAEWPALSPLSERHSWWPRWERVFI